MDPDPVPVFTTVLRIPHPDHTHQDAEFVLLHVSSTGRRKLDLKLIGTEEEHVFVVELKHSDISALKLDSCTQDEWEDILLSVLREVTPANEAVRTDVELSAKVEKKAKSLTITIQRRVEGITQKLGQIPMKAKDPESVEISLFDWCGTVVTSRDQSSRELHALHASLGEKDAQMKKLEESLAELVTLKEQHDNALLEKFSLLLNEKKLKIRDQQHLLAGSTIDPVRLEEVEAPRRNSRSHSTGPSRARKRKVKEVVVESDSDDGFEKMEVDEANSAKDSDMEDRQTPEPSTASEASDGDGPPPLSSRTINQDRISKESTPAIAPPEDFVLPPKRELPFQRKPGAAKPVAKPSTKPVVDGSDTESDDEL
ncbi:hypothetical protein HYALB_00012869 [Hymenoscyphus albidus]|uniref:Mitotic apparatus protein p62 n=1 Tax=Hymenoscyphus albidus TaxID=595503 RepID=A0A9N9LYH6_9HELO|nr:hypothetical protein HYALB_00012869 [Hymenoscyphus albidus]